MLPAPALEMRRVIAPEHSAAIARFAKAIGLALGLGPRSAGLNLRKGPLAFERGFAWVKEKVPLLAGLAAVILVSFLFSAWAQLYAKSKEKAVLEKALATVTKDVLGEETTSAAARERAPRRADLAERRRPAAARRRVRRDGEALRAHPAVDDARHRGARHPEEHVIVHGIVGSIPDAQAIKTSLDERALLLRLKITRTTAQVGGTAQKYVLEFDIKCPEDTKGGAKKPAGSRSAARRARRPADGR